eukprot:36071-Chlamydomonas_euryale.AAC.1
MHPVDAPSDQASPPPAPHLPNSPRAWCAAPSTSRCSRRRLPSRCFGSPARHCAAPGVSTRLCPSPRPAPTQGQSRAAAAHGSPAWPRPRRLRGGAGRRSNPLWRTMRTGAHALKGAELERRCIARYAMSRAALPSMRTCVLMHTRPVLPGWSCT